MQYRNDINRESIHFGWHDRMHSDIVKNVQKKPNDNSELDDIFLEAVKKPDSDERFLLGQYHFYYPDDKVKSYLDYTGTHNARYCYRSHIKNALKLFRLGNIEKSTDEAGRALHYLQDVTEPHHIDSGSIIDKAKDALMPHHKFEMDTFAKEDEFFKNYTPVNIRSNSFSDLFDETVILSQQTPVPVRNNIETWDDIAQNSINLVLSVTSKFLELLPNIKK